MRRDEAVHALLHTGDHYGALAEIDLELLARTRFKAHRGAGVIDRVKFPR